MNINKTKVLNAKSSGYVIFAEALRVFKKHFHKILYLLTLCAFVNVAFIGLEFYLSGNIAHILIQSNYLGDILNDPDIGYSVYLRQILLSKAGLLIFTLIYLLNLIFSYCINLSSLKIINNGSSPLKALSYIGKKIMPIFITDVMAVLTLLIALFFAILLGCIFFFVGQLTHMIVAIVGIVLVVILVFVLLLRLLFCSQICVLEEKYYFEALDLSFKYSKNNVLAISYKVSALFVSLFIISVLVLWPLSLIEMPHTFLAIKYVMFALVFPQISTIYNYLLFRIYRKK